jgi:N,N'-diacetyllegionaminate synthase
MFKFDPELFNPNFAWKIPLVVAEIGINHNGDMVLAKEMIHAAAESGADSIKFQNYKTDDFVFDKALQIKYQSRGQTISESQYKLFRRCELSLDQLSELKQECDSVGVLFHSTPTSYDGINELQSIGCKLLKNGSDYLTNHRLVRAMGESGLPTILSTGMANIDEIDQAVRVFRATGNACLMLLHCTSSYPTPIDQVNLSRIKSLATTFGVATGFSDHTKGITAAVGASFLGARWIEKHFTLSPDLEGPDHWFSMTPDELSKLVNSVHASCEMLGSSIISPTVAEIDSRKQYRLSCCASHELSPGHIITPDDISFLRPGTGLPPFYDQSLIGLKVISQIQNGQQFHFSLLSGHYDN